MDPIIDFFLPILFSTHLFFKLTEVIIKKYLKQLINEVDKVSIYFLNMVILASQFQTLKIKLE